MFFLPYAHSPIQQHLRSRGPLSLSPPSPLPFAPPFSIHFFRFHAHLLLVGIAHGPCEKRTLNWLWCWEFCWVDCPAPLYQRQVLASLVVNLFLLPDLLKCEKGPTATAKPPPPRWVASLRPWATYIFPSLRGGGCLPHNVYEAKKGRGGARAQILLLSVASMFLEDFFF